MMTEGGFWTTPVNLGSVSFTPLSLVIGCVLLVLAILVQRLLTGLLRHRLFPRFRIHPGLGNAYAILGGYVFLVLSLILIGPLTFQGLNWATFSVILGAISLGVGFGLRNIADNFVSGLIILLERPVKVGDRVTIDETSGTVASIRARSTTVRTNDRIEVIIPNSRFISASVINWSHSDNRVRFRIPVGVHYQSDVFEVREVLEEAALEHEDVLRDPAPSAKFVAFGDSSLNFEVWVWTVKWTLRPAAFKSEINFLIWKHLKAAGIQVPYPQRDLYIKEWPGPALPGQSHSPLN